MANNLRILYDNVADSATLSASSTAGGLTVINLQKELKGLVWRSVGTSATITATWTNTQVLSGVILPFCNLGSQATIRIRVYTLTTDPTPALDTGTINAGAIIPTDIFNGNYALSSSVTAYSYGGGSYSRAWFTATPGKKLVVDIEDTTNPAGYLEASRLICGNFWSPTYNTSFGIQIGYSDTGQQSRTESGNLVTSVGTLHRTMTFDLSWLTDTDRSKILSILRGNRLTKPLFVSLFPNDTDTSKEQAYQIYGKLNSLGTLTHPVYSTYSTSITIDEI